MRHYNSLRTPALRAPSPLLTAFCLAIHFSGPVTAAKQPPPQIIWSWFADDDFRPLADRGAGVAYLGLSLTFDGQARVTPSTRALPIRISPKT